MLADLTAIESRLNARMPDPLTPAFQLWRTEQRQDTRDLIRDLRETREREARLQALWASVQQEGAGRLD